MASAFWSEGCSPGAKRALLAALVLCFTGQSYLVYSDPVGRELVSPLAVAGRRVWQARGCNTCHQLYGFGGFLGPDLTNASERLAPGRLEEVLTRGTGPMPAFELPPEDIAALSAFLAAMNHSGRGQARRITQGPTVSERIEARLPGGPVREGFEVFRSRCLACHVPLGRSPVDAPDPSLIDLPPDALLRVLTAGKPPRMPNPGLEPSEREHVSAFLGWLKAARPDLEAAPAGELPWWTYR